MTCTTPASPKRPLTCTLPGTRASLCPSPEGAHDQSTLGKGLPASSLKDQIANIPHFVPQGLLSSSSHSGAVWTRGSPAFSSPPPLLDPLNRDVLSGGYYYYY